MGKGLERHGESTEDAPSAEQRLSSHSCGQEADLLRMVQRKEGTDLSGTCCFMEGGSL